LNLRRGTPHRRINSGVIVTKSTTTETCPQYDVEALRVALNTAAHSVVS
jgi:hypothetical protein